eukprot:CAMPEP_0115003088 /NCGR_PEP_ID=MMETSP0216-20121206/18388_1 /TAXON_ID=223996 /ORGANISM="Protocruzia adherens, Strain Boccale" /LENGTH=431 /DNA_ID=CAMNT_0002368797 /DNA_START=371 /DNA_END=1662 /DNA_ORIENTATION=-
MEHLSTVKVSFWFFALFGIIAAGQRAPVQAALEDFLSKEGPSNLFSAVELSYWPQGNSESLNLVAGTTALKGTQGVTTENLFGWGSITKQFTSSMIFQLIAQQKLTLTNTLEDMLPEFFGTKVDNSWPEAWSKITLFQLLNMSSGIPDYVEFLFVLYPGEGPKVFKHPWTPETLVGVAVTAWETHFDECQSRGFCFPPGSSWAYSNTDYTIAGLILSKFHGGISIQEVFQDNLFSRRNGEPDGQIYLANGILPKRVLDAMPESYTNIFNSTVTTNVTDLPWYALGAGGGLIGSMNTLAGMIRQYFQGDFLDNTADLDILLSEYYFSMATRKKVQDITTDCPEACYGLGIEARSNDQLGVIFTYHGEPIGYETVYVHIPCYDFTLTISVNGAYISPTNHLLDYAALDMLLLLYKEHPHYFSEQVNPKFCPKS